MAALVGKRVRTTQPQPGEATLIDWDNPITKDMTVCLMHADQAYGFDSYIDGSNAPAFVNVVPYTGGAQSNTPLGTGGRPTGSAGMYDLTSKGAVDSSSYSLFAFGTCTSTSATQSSLDMDNSSIRNFQFRLAAGKVDFIPFNGSGSPTGQATSPVALTLAEMSRGFTMGATASPTRTAAFQNGVVTVGSAPSGLSTPSVSIPIRVGARLTNTQVWSTGALMLVAVWRRTLADSEMQSLADNPWQLFKPKQRRLYMVTVATSGDGSTTLAGVSATSAVGTVTATGGASTTLTGTQAMSAVAGVAASGDASVNIASAHAASAVASVTAIGDANAALTGVSAASGTGSIVASAGGSATAPITGVSATSAVSTVTATGDATAPLGATYSQGKVDVIDAEGGASTITIAVQAVASVGTIAASGTTGSATATLQGVSAAVAVGTITASGTRTTIEVDVTEDMICRAVRAYIKSIASALPVVRTPVNRASMPKGAYVSFTPGLRRPLSTNRATHDDNSRTVSRPEQMSFQIDCYGVGSAELAETLNVLYRDVYACDLFDSLGFSGAPLYAGDVQQAPFVNGEDQYEDRYTFEIELQVNSRVIVPLQSCNILGIDLVSVDATFPPTEE